MSFINPVTVINLARAKVPAVNYALGLAGIAAAAAIIIAMLGYSKASLVIVAVVGIGAVLLYAFSQLINSGGGGAVLAGSVLMWAIVAFFIIFLMFTTTAVAIGKPCNWVWFLNLPSTSDCKIDDRVVPGNKAKLSISKFTYFVTDHLIKSNDEKLIGMKDLDKKGGIYFSASSISDLFIPFGFVLSGFQLKGTSSVDLRIETWLERNKKKYTLDKNKITTTDQWKTFAIPRSVGVEKVLNELKIFDVKTKIPFAVIKFKFREKNLPEGAYEFNILVVDNMSNSSIRYKHPVSIGFIAASTE